MDETQETNEADKKPPIWINAIDLPVPKDPAEMPIYAARKASGEIAAELIYLESLTREKMKAENRAKGPIFTPDPDELEGMVKPTAAEAATHIPEGDRYFVDGVFSSWWRVVEDNMHRNPAMPDGGLIPDTNVPLAAIQQLTAWCSEIKLGEREVAPDTDPITACLADQTKAIETVEQRFPEKFVQEAVLSVAQPSEFYLKALASPMIVEFTNKVHEAMDRS